jgi:hypothetical protein
VDIGTSREDVPDEVRADKSSTAGYEKFQEKSPSKLKNLD